MRHDQTIASPGATETISVDRTTIDDGEQFTATLTDTTDSVVVDSVQAQISLTDVAYVQGGSHWTGASAIQKAVDNTAAESGPIHVETGHYNAFSLTKDLTVQNAQSATPVVDQQAGGPAAMVWVQSASAGGATVKGLTVDAQNSSTKLGIKVRGGGYDVTGDTVTLDSNTIKNTQTAIQVASSAPVDISGNIIKNVAAGVSVQTDEVTVNSNTISVASNGEGVAVAGSATITNNDITVNSEYTSKDQNSNYAYKEDRPGRAIWLVSGTPVSEAQVRSQKAITLEPDDLTAEDEIVDDVAPTMSVSSLSVSSATDTLTVDFSEDVSNVDAADDFTVEVSTSGDTTTYETSDAGVTSITDAGDSDASTYTITLTNDFADGSDVRVTVDEGSSEIQDNDGNTATGAQATATS